MMSSSHHKYTASGVQHSYVCITFNGMDSMQKKWISWKNVFHEKMRSVKNTHKTFFFYDLNFKWYAKLVPIDLEFPTTTNKWVTNKYPLFSRQINPFEN